MNICHIDVFLAGLTEEVLYGFFLALCILCGHSCKLFSFKPFALCKMGIIFGLIWITDVLAIQFIQ